MNTKIFFTDLDGTLLTDEKQVSPLTMETLRQWCQTGNHLVLCSGRALDSVVHVRKTLGLTFPHVHLIGCNGGEIYDCDSDTLLLRRSVPLDIVEKVFTLAKEYGIYMQTYNDTHIVTTTEGPELTYYCRFIHTPVIVDEDYLSHLDKEPGKCLAIGLTDLPRLEEFKQALEGALSSRVQVMYSNPNYLEIIPADSGKGTGVKWLCDYLHIPLSRSLAAGDEANDISMLEAAGTGIAMANARDAVKEIADIITPADNNHDGLVPLLQDAMSER